MSSWEPDLTVDPDDLVRVTEDGEVLEDSVAGEYTAEDYENLRHIRHDYYRTVLQIHWASLTRWQKNRIRRIDPLLYEAVKHLAEERP